MGDQICIVDAHYEEESSFSPSCSCCHLGENMPDSDHGYDPNHYQDADSILSSAQRQRGELAGKRGLLLEAAAGCDIFLRLSGSWDGL